MRIQIDGNPIPDSRPRVTRYGTYNPRYREKNRIRTYLLSLGIKPLSEPLKVSLVFFMSIPNSTSKKKCKDMIDGMVYHDKKPDLDNLVKFVFDSCTGILFDDDKQIVELTAFKWYGEVPHTVIDIEPASVSEVDPFNDIMDAESF